ncbi:uncharacterized protein LOC6548743 [Drosophila erecta]|uniref:Secreted protein n=1 Tax=Drosophila erecta TaxID=7220 RepID=B3NKX7_DROER|nr:uncharacterized protein LOC6548743 [Drosophila erecta]EDV54500.1 uncharacterized protein Dere_GG21543 [Drosophila erecta]
MMATLLLALPLLFTPADAALGTQVASYDHKRMLLLIADFNGTAAEQLLLAAATWGKLRADYPRDVAKIEDLEETLNHVVCRKQSNVTVRHHLQGYLIREQIREHLQTLNSSDLFQQALQSEDHELGKWQLAIGQHSRRLHCLLKPGQLSRLIEAVIRRVYTLEGSTRLAALLYQLYLGNRESYASMVEAELMLYERYKSGGKNSLEFGGYVAKLWQSIQMEEFYPGLDQHTKQRLVDAVIDLLRFL